MTRMDIACAFIGLTQSKSILLESAGRILAAEQLTHDCRKILFVARDMDMTIDLSLVTINFHFLLQTVYTYMHSSLAE